MTDGKGWYPDPDSPKHRRYWNGRQWSQRRILTRSAFWSRIATITGASVCGILVLFVVVALLSPQPSETAAPASSSTSATSNVESATPSAGGAASPSPTTSPRATITPTATSKPSTPVTKPTSHPRSKSSPTASPSRRTAAPGTVLAAAELLTQKGRAPKTGYSRDQFGSAWSDTDGNGCDQREDVLNRDLTHKTFDGCLVLRGTLHDPYTSRTIHFHRGESTSSAVQIDHVVSESDAWQTGAQQWSAAKRLRFATDTLNLYAVDGPTNESKGDGDTATWLPPNKSFRCTYVGHQVAVKKKYGLWVTPAERSAMVRVLSGCPSTKVPRRTAIPSHPASRPSPAPKRHHPAGTGGGNSGSSQSGGGSGSSNVGVVHPGAFCSPEGATGVTSKGTPMICKTTATDSRARWRSR